MLVDKFNVQDFGEFMKANRLAPVLNQLQMSSSSKQQPIERGTSVTCMSLTCMSVTCLYRNGSSGSTVHRLCFHMMQ